MSEDPIVQEVRRIRQEHAARFDYDLQAIFADLKRTEEARDQQQSLLLAPPEPGEIAASPALHQTANALRRVGRI
ncbi:MAG: hypothetical protein WAM82_07215 [Thermoanaerobaculia bacterium]